MKRLEWTPQFSPKTTKFTTEMSHAPSASKRVIDQPIEQVWHCLRDFNGRPAWHPHARESRIEDAGPADRVGCARVVRLVDGSLVKERLMGLSDLEHTLSYTVIESTLPVADLVAKFAVTSITRSGATLVDWSISFEKLISTAPDLAGVLLPGLDGLAAAMAVEQPPTEG